MPGRNKQNTQRQILRFLAEQEEGVSLLEIAQAVGRAKSTVNQHVYRLANLGFVIIPRTAVGAPSKYGGIMISDDGRRFLGVPVP